MLYTTDIMAEADNISTTETTNTKHAGGRPTKLTKEMVDKASNYIGQMARYELISVVGLAVYLDVAESSVYLWATLDGELSNKFSETLGKIKTFQHYQLINKGLTGDYKAPIATLILSKNHDYIQRTATDLTTNGKELPTPILGGTTNVIPGNDSDPQAS